MGDDEVEKLRREKLEAKKAQEQLKATLRMALEAPAYDRMMNVSVANNELFLTAAKNALMLFKRAGRPLAEDEIVALLRAIKDQSEKKTTIKFHKK